MDTDVLIVGAGPTGLMLACWLARLGIHPMVIEKKAGLTSESRAVGVQARTLETYDMLGIVDRALPQGVPVKEMNLLINRRLVGRVKMGEIGKGLSPYPYFFVMSQDRTERLLFEAFTEQAGQVRWETTIGDLVQDEQGVNVELQRADGKSERVRARYVCGCDGASSQVRHALNLDFPGGTYPQHFYVADALITSPQPEGVISISIDGDRFHALFPMPGPNHYRVLGYVPPELTDKTDLTFEDVRSTFEDSMGAQVAKVFWFSTYNTHHRIAEHFQRGRVFLLGDAAHIHSPAGGQGMNTGLMDASNLGWKLAAVLQGEAGERLLASYEPERMAFAHLLVATTDRVFTAASSPTLRARLFRSAIVAPLFSGLSQLPQMRRWFFGTISQTRLNYRHSPMSRGAASLVQAGDRLPWVKCSDGSSNYDALCTLKVHLQVYGTVSPEIEGFTREHPEVPVKQFSFTPEAARAGLQEGACYLLRPDGYVAYASPQFSSEELLAYLRDVWCWREVGAKVE
ncbi:FAD-dependent monooxygenase [Dictyobacter aurantiacus]|uniref:2-polyprenyl-6-methoxyphenol hydroxylase n=1 Tax=Dictyobacter aurantiacus TaxID=1936993 RepID=A0A401ZT17_9CHLR|nr:FAD-dependent monooxygenase [Dictyobacter aurantiacus]GCE10058.1 2-polyprenyl-6-methoxyphenol hydroxylase [Dictyobacter aurantiacus]